MTKLQFLLILAVFNLLLFIACAVFVLYGMQNGLFTSNCAFVFALPAVSTIGSGFLFDDNISRLN